MKLPKLHVKLPKVLKHLKAPGALPKKFFALSKLEKILILLIIFALLQIAAILLIFTPSLRQSKQSLVAAASKLSIKSSKESLWSVNSKYGFQVTFDSNIFTADSTVLLSSDGTIDHYTDKKLLSPANFFIVDIYPQDLKENSSMSVLANIKGMSFEERRKGYGGNLSDLEIAEKLFEQKSDEDITYKLIKREKVKLGTVEYLRLDYSTTYKGFSSVLKDCITTVFVTAQNGRPYAVKLYYNSDKSPYYKAFLGIAEKIKFSPPAKDAPYLSSSEDAILADVEDLGTGKTSYRVVGAKEGSHQVLGESTSATKTDAATIKVVATNMPAVVRIGTTYCADISLGKHDGTVALMGNSLCAAVYGSGFFISGDGYIGTNGHVVKLSPRLPLEFAILLGDREVIKNVILWVTDEAQAATGETYDLGDIDAKLDKIVADPQALKYLANFFGEDASNPFPESLFSAKNEKSQYAIQLGKEPIKIKFTLGANKTNIGLTFTSSVLEAKLIGYDYSTSDLLNQGLNPDAGFTASDVALLKVDGKNFPFVQMGNINSLVSGSEITVIGYPGIADNPAVETNESKATATKGIVSAIREAKGNKKKLVQSDVSIEAGNSGGPAFDSDGKVIGIASLSMQSESGTYNYMRDIQDLKDLIAKNNVTLDKNSDTQKVWEKGLGKFLKAYYSSAIKEFESVLKAYPPHVLAGDYITIAKDKIANGEEQIDPTSLYWLVIPAVVTVSAIILVVFVLRRRKRRVGGEPIPQMPYPPGPMPVPTPGAVGWSGAPTPGYPSIPAPPPRPLRVPLSPPPVANLGPVVEPPTYQPSAPPTLEVPKPPQFGSESEYQPPVAEQLPSAEVPVSSSPAVSRPITEAPSPSKEPAAPTPVADVPPPTPGSTEPMLAPQEGIKPLKVASPPIPSVPLEAVPEKPAQPKFKPLEHSSEPETEEPPPPGPPPLLEDLKESLEKKINKG